MNVFFDSSALVKRYLEEPGSDKVERLCRRSSRIIVSITCLPEIISALNRRKREEAVSSRQYLIIKDSLLLEFEDFLSCPLTPQVIASTIGILEQFPLRAMDAIHLACAAEVSALFVSADLRQLEAAKKLKLRTRKV